MPIVKNRVLARDEDLKAKFRNADARLIAALNGIGRPVANQAEAVRLRREVLRARGKCEDAGVLVETLWESVQRRRAENEEQVRRFAGEQRSVVSTVPRPLRTKLSIGAGLVVALIVALSWQDVACYVAAVVSWVVAWGLLDTTLARVFPTPGISVGRFAAQRHVGSLDLWPSDSDDAKDYELGYRLEANRMRQSGEATGWIRTR